MTSEKEQTLVRGKAIASMPKFIKKKFGKEGYEKWLNAISADAYRIFILPIKNSEWYPLKITMVEPCANIAQLFYNWDIKKAAWEIGRFSADYGLNNILKIFVRMGPAGYLVKKSGEILTSYYKPVASEIANFTGSSGILRITKFPGIDKTMEYRISGWIERALEISGCKNVKIDIPKSLSNFQPFTEFHITWE